MSNIEGSQLQGCVFGAYRWNSCVFPVSSASPSLCFPAPRPAQFRCRWCSWPSSNRAGGAPYRVTYRFTDCSCCCGKVQENAEADHAQTEQAGRHTEWPTDSQIAAAAAARCRKTQRLTTLKPSRRGAIPSDLQIHRLQLLLRQGAGKRRGWLRSSRAGGAPYRVTYRLQIAAAAAARCRKTQRLTTLKLSRRGAIPSDLQIHRLQLLLRQGARKRRGWPRSNRAGGAPYRVTYRFTDCSCCCGKVQEKAETPLAQKVMKAGDSANLRRRLQVHPCITDSTINIINFVLSNWSFQMYFLWPGDHLVGAFTVLAWRREFLADSFPLTLQAGGRHTAACSNLHFLKMSWPQCIFSTCCLRRWTRLAKIDRENPQLVS